MRDCSHAERMARFSPMAALRGHRPCRQCGSRFYMAPSLDVGAAGIALLLASLLPSLAEWPASPWLRALISAAATLMVYLALKIGAAHLVPFRHVAALDAATSRYRIMIIFMIAVGIAFIAVGRPPGS